MHQIASLSLAMTGYFNLLLRLNKVNASLNCPERPFTPNIKSVTATKKSSAEKANPTPENDIRTFTFETVLEKMDRIGGSYYLQFPWDVQELFGTKASVRILGTYNGVKVDRALLPHGDGTHYLLISLELAKKCKLRLGEKVKVEFIKHPNPTEIEVPEELGAALDLEPGAWEKYSKLNPGQQRNIVYWINSGKRPETREKRALEMMNRIVTGVISKPAKKEKVSDE